MEIYKFTIVNRNSEYISISLPERTSSSLQYPTSQIIKVSFAENSNLLLRSSATNIPIQSSTYTADLPIYEPYSSGPYSQFKVLGQVCVIFLLLAGAVLFVFNWYAKIYESLHLFQLIFLLSVLEIRLPPNIWLFLQGFKDSHFYFVGNWFIAD